MYARTSGSQHWCPDSEFRHALQPAATSSGAPRVRASGAGRECGAVAVKKIASDRTDRRANVHATAAMRHRTHG
jgi:hypothetical protein